MAFEFTSLEQVIFICGRYEGIDERVAKFLVDLNLSIGNYVLMGGEVPAMVVIEAVSRLIPGVVGKSEILRKERVKDKGVFIEYPQYTRPEVFVTKEGKKLKVPKVLLSGDHKKIEEWRKKHQKVIE
jgi:tRNA (guanine37-N1)-methyltransferase